MTRAWEARKDFLRVEKQNQMPKVREVRFQGSSVCTQLCGEGPEGSVSHGRVAREWNSAEVLECIFLSWGIPPAILLLILLH